MNTVEFLQSLSRFQFGLNAGFHYLFVPLSLGLLLCVNILNTRQLAGQAVYDEQAGRLFTRFFLLTWLVGIATGYPLRWQLSEYWGAYGQAAKPVLKAIFEIEGLIGPLMLTGVALVAFGRRLLGTAAHTVAGWLLWILMLGQAFTILSVNAWMQSPTGVHFTGEVWALDSLRDILLSSATLHKVAHTLSAAMLTGALFVLWVACGYQRQGRHEGMNRSSIQVAAWVGALATAAVLLSGHESAAEVARTQPMKFAAMEAHWRAEPGPAPLVVFAVPDEAAGHNRFELRIPYLLSALTSGTVEAPQGIHDLVAVNEGKIAAALHQPESEALRGWHSLYESVAQRQGAVWSGLSMVQRLHLVAQASVPPVKGLFTAFHVMAFSGVLLALLMATVFVCRHGLSEGRYPALARVVRWSLPLPWLATLSGWGVAEIGRQPWTVYEQMPTWRASTLPSVPAAFQNFVLMLVIGLLIAVTFVWLARLIYRCGPQALVIRWPASRVSRAIGRRAMHGEAPIH